MHRDMFKIQDGVAIVEKLNLVAMLGANLKSKCVFFKHNINTRGVHVFE